MSLLLRLNFSHYELPITYIKEFLTEILIYRSRVPGYVTDFKQIEATLDYV